MAEMKIVDVPPQFKAMLKSQAAIQVISLSEYVLAMLKYALQKEEHGKQAAKPKKARARP
jgi:hypothetical protein